MRPLLLSVLAALVPAFTHPVGAAPPNIIFIFSDDHAQHAISAYGSKVNRTPNIDRLASEGVRFANSFVTNSICTPSRATLLTGQYSHLNGVPVFNLPENRQTIANDLTRQDLKLPPADSKDPGGRKRGESKPTEVEVDGKILTGKELVKWKYKLIHYWQKDAYEMFDLTRDPTEQHNLLFSEAEAKQPEVEAKFAELKAEIARLQKEYKDDGLYADPSTWPPGSAGGPFNACKPTGARTIAEAIDAAGSK